MFDNDYDIYDQVYQEDDANLVKKSPLENIAGYIFQSVKLDRENKKFIIKGMNFAKFYARLREMYKYRGIQNLFEKKFSAWDMFLWKKEKKKKQDMKVVNVSVPLFFALEIYKIFEELGHFYNLSYYNRVSHNIWIKTWISNFETINPSETDTSNLSNLKFTLKDYQLDFIKKYNILKVKYDLEGYILTFEQGLGKTLTAIALAECLDKSQVVIVCPNSLRENWAYEIKSYFSMYENQNRWINDIYVKGSPKFMKSKNPKYIIVNQENITSIFNIVKPNKDTMIIVDECHNFRNMKSNRSEDLIKLKNKVKSKDNLMMSGTPIKANPNEIIPCLRMIDPYFTEEMADLYRKSFNQYTQEIVRVVKERFGRVIYRKTKQEVLKLPEKTVTNLYLKISKPERYLISTLKKQVLEIYNEQYLIKMANYRNLKQEYESIVIKYSSAPKKVTLDYLKYIYLSNSPNERTPEIHEYRSQLYKNFLNTYVYPNIDDPAITKRLEYIHTQYVYVRNSAMGVALGQILPPARTNCYIEIFDYNIDKFIKAIDNNIKKTIIFTQFLQVAKHVSKGLTERGVGNVLIIGETKNRMELIKMFKETDSIDVLVATTQTLSTGVTLTEANQVFFFGTPYRDADFQQACDRTHRIGQTMPVKIFVTLLDTIKPNITTRIDDIMNWSKEATNSIMDESYDLFC